MEGGKRDGAGVLLSVAFPLGRRQALAPRGGATNPSCLEFLRVCALECGSGHWKTAAKQKSRADRREKESPARGRSPAEPSSGTLGGCRRYVPQRASPKRGWLGHPTIILH